MWYYYNFLVRRPYLLVIAIAVLCLACIIVSFANSMPDFSDPTLGFEARGTVIGKRLKAWHNLLQETEPGGRLVADPNEIVDNYRVQQQSHFVLHKSKHHKGRKHNNKKHRKRKRKQKHQNTKLVASNELIPDNQYGDVQTMSPAMDDEELEERQHSQDLNRSPLQWNGDNGIFRDYEITANDSWTSMEHFNRSEHFEYGRNMTSIDEDFHREKIQTKKSTWRMLKQAAVPPGDSIHDDSSMDGYFCDSPVKEYSHFVVERIGPNATDSLFDLNGILAMCELQDQITAITSYRDYCQRENWNENNCCRPWSLSNYAALLSNKSSCFDLNQDDVNLLKNLLLTCFEYYHDLKLSNDCNKYNRCYGPPECTNHNMVFNILHFLTDYNVIKINDSNIYLKYAMIFVPVVHTTKILPLFHEWEQVELKNELVRVIAMDLGLENELFNELLLTDAWLISLGGVFVMACMWLYTTSLFMTIMTCIAVLFSLGLAYFIYTLVFELAFFPYMNLLAAVVLIGIGADDAFLFVKIWQCVLTERFTKTSTVTTQSLSVEMEHTETLQHLMALTLRHAAVSMCVSSLTTAVAFYASYTSSITAIKCFGIFAGTAVMANYTLMVTWLPASVSIMERMSARMTCSKLQVQKIFLLLNKSINKFCIVFESIVVSLVMKYSVLWIILFTTIGICSVVIVLYFPGLQLPETTHFQLFTSSHPFEAYNSKYKREFWFEKSMTAYDNFKMPLRFVWGIEAIDDGDYLDPFSHGSLHFDNNFNISSKLSQRWLWQFCRNLRQQPFYQLTFGLLLPNCFIENFISFMSRMCIDGMDDTDRTPCCDISKFPYEPYIFEMCLPLSISSLYATPRELFTPGFAGPKFYVDHEESHISNEPLNENMTNITEASALLYSSSSIPIVKALVIEFESNFAYTTVYGEVRTFVETVEKWFKKELSTAPASMQNGWFVSELKFYDVQDTLARDTLIAITVAMAASLVVLLLSTLNLLISLYAVITVMLTIFTTVAILILMGWKLNVLESVAVSTAIGLALDFSLHYSIHYRMSPTQCERIAATQFSLSRIIGPTVMAGITTGFAGAIMLASNVLPYIQIGIFLVIVMTVSWLYATFYLMSLLKLSGPQYGFMQYSLPRFGKRQAPNGIKYYERKQSQVIASEQLLTPSSSAVGEHINSETHELDSLASNTVIKTISGGECIQQQHQQHQQEQSHGGSLKLNATKLNELSANQPCSSISLVMD